MHVCISLLVMRLQRTSQRVLASRSNKFASLLVDCYSRRRSFNARIHGTRPTRPSPWVDQRNECRVGRLETEVWASFRQTYKYRVVVIPAGGISHRNEGRKESHLYQRQTINLAAV